MKLQFTTKNPSKAPILSYKEVETDRCRDYRNAGMQFHIAPAPLYDSQVILERHPIFFHILILLLKDTTVTSM
jgi:hypothetical protein